MPIASFHYLHTAHYFNTIGPIPRPKCPLDTAWPSNNNVNKQKMLNLQLYVSNPTHVPLIIVVIISYKYGWRH